MAAGVDQLAAEDTEVAEYVAALEDAMDDADTAGGLGDAIAREFERYLRRRSHEQGGGRACAASISTGTTSGERIDVISTGDGTGPDGRREDRREKPPAANAPALTAIFTTARPAKQSERDTKESIDGRRDERGRAGNAAQPRACSHQRSTASKAAHIEIYGQTPYLGEDALGGRPGLRQGNRPPPRSAAPSPGTGPTTSIPNPRGTDARAEGGAAPSGRPSRRSCDTKTRLPVDLDILAPLSPTIPALA